MAYIAQGTRATFAGNDIAGFIAGEIDIRSVSVPYYTLNSLFPRTIRTHQYATGGRLLLLTTLATAKTVAQSLSRQAPGTLIQYYLDESGSGTEKNLTIGSSNVFVKFTGVASHAFPAREDTRFATHAIEYLIQTTLATATIDDILVYG